MNNQKREEAVEALIKIDRVKGMIETIALRKKFLKHLESKKKSRVGKHLHEHTLRTNAKVFLFTAAPPAIVVNQHRISRPLNMMDLYSAPPTPATPTADFSSRMYDDNASMGSGGDL